MCKSADGEGGRKPRNRMFRSSGKCRTRRVFDALPGGHDGRPHVKLTDDEWIEPDENVGLPSTDWTTEGTAVSRYAGNETIWHVVRKQEARLSLTNRATHLCKLNGVTELTKTRPLPMCVDTPNLVVLGQIVYAQVAENPQYWGLLGPRRLGMGSLMTA